MWGGATNGQYGYGHFNVGGVIVKAYRYAYERFVGPIPSELELDHLCRTPRCVNPWHLEAVTHAVNVRRGTAWVKIAALSRARRKVAGP